MLKKFFNHKAYTYVILMMTFVLSYEGFSQTKYKAFHPGELWLDDQGDHINAHGGGILYHKGTYYWFGENKGKDSNNAFVGIMCYSSKDLYNWKREAVALPVSTDPDSEITAGSIMERPKVIYNKKTKKFVMWFHLELKGQGYAAARTGVAVSDKPGGPYEYKKSYRPNAGQWPENFQEEWKDRPATTEADWWTEPWRKEVKEGLFVRRDFEKGQMSRDMTLFVDDDGKAYHIHSAEENLTLHISELSDDYLSFTGRYITLAPGGHNEAPAIFKQDGVYYLITSGCTGWDPNAARSFKSNSMWGPWEYLGNPAQGEHANLTFYSQSTYILPVHGKKNAYIYMGDRWRPKDPIDGRYIWLPVFLEHDKPVIKWFDEWDLSIFDQQMH
ncbi:glycoside hydrolase family 43 protein [Fulvivirga maritima]|uniref:glycoside hydrolase family 43 protein n=1 Tax=Fulvivirga maritima TaxID=2904247 RepID=UPI001F372700|nr:glycoside hydrolase family 43 protein [Fulvivirga maritima]UII24882.1 glycoside hydrolase family 43 protein [Fulvivirga maritima]